MERIQALQYTSFGDPSEVLELTELYPPPLGPDEVEIRLLAAPINPSDFGMISGSYGRTKELPAVAGREGVAEVVETGMGVAALRAGDRVVFPGDVGTWQSGAVVRADDLRLLPKDLPLEFACMTVVNPPTAWRILRDAHLPAGSWVVQNGSNSAVGMFVVQMARHLGLHTLNVVRNERWIEPLKKLGADVVVLEESGYEKELDSLLGRERPALAINSIGGQSALRLVRCLRRGGVHVTIGAMTFDPVRFPTRQLIFDDITLKGFWMDRWYRENSKPRAQIMFENLFNLARDGIIEVPVAAKFPLSQYREALAANRETRLGKILFVPDES